MELGSGLKLLVVSTVAVEQVQVIAMLLWPEQLPALHLLLSLRPRPKLVKFSS